MIRIILILILLFPTNVYANEGSVDYAVAATIKTLARGYVQVMDVDRFKEKYTKNLLKMDEVKFQKRYRNIYGFLENISPSLRVRYGFTENMTKENAVKGIRQLDKNDLMQAIDEVPDQVIVKQVKSYLEQINKNVDQNYIQKIDSLWEKMTQRA